MRIIGETGEALVADKVAYGHANEYGSLPKAKNIRRERSIEIDTNCWKMRERKRGIEKEKHKERERKRERGKRKRQRKKGERKTEKENNITKIKI